MKTCSQCNKHKEQFDFYVDRRAKSGLASRCKVCTKQATRAWEAANREQTKLNKREWNRRHKEQVEETRRKWRLENPEKAAEQARRFRDRDPSRHRIYRLKSKFGMSDADYQACLQAQGHQCGICRTATAARFDVDHDHRSGQVRGLLCRKCNTGIGLLGENLETLQNAIAYLNRPQLGFRGKR